MIEDVVMGFLTSFHLGIVWGYIAGWSEKAFAATLVGMAAFTGFVFMFNGVSETAQSMNWAVVVGTVPGWVFGIGAGMFVYNELWCGEEEDKRKPARW